jgi:hypothetical protein
VIAPHAPDEIPYGHLKPRVLSVMAMLKYHYVLPGNKIKAVLQELCGLKVSEGGIAQALQRLGRYLGEETEVVLGRIRQAAYKHADETGWKIDDKRCYAWIFTSVLHTVLLYGESRGEEILDLILPRSAFHGIGVSDCLKIYKKRFRKAQKCWAHFLRIAIRLTLGDTDNSAYRQFFDSLYAIFTDARKAQENEMLTEKQRENTVVELQERITALCTRDEEKIPKDTPQEEREFINLQKRMVRNIDDLFTFVLVPEVEATNNRAERGFRKTAKARNNYQTSKTKRGAERRSVIASVLTSLRQNMEHYTLASITEEIIRWRTEGTSLFEKQLRVLQLGSSP